MPRTDRPPRSRYLEFASELARAIEPGAAGFQLVAADISLQAVSAVMHRSRTSLYRLWETQNAFHTDLTLFLIQHQDFESPDSDLPWRLSLEREMASTDAPNGAHLIERLRVALDRVQEHIVADSWIAVRAATIGYGNPGELAPPRELVERQRLQNLATTIQDTLSAAGLAVKPPVRPEDLATGLWCLADGFATLALALPDLRFHRVHIDDGNGPRPWGLFAYIGRCLLAATITKIRDRPTTTSNSAPEAEPSAVGRTWTLAQLQALQVGAQLFTDRLAPLDGNVPGKITGLAHLSIARLARRAGVTRRSVYDIWATSEDLRIDLLRNFLHAETRTMAERLHQLVRGRAPTTPQAALSALVRGPDPHQLSQREAADTFLLDARHPIVDPILQRSTAAGLRSIADAVDRVWPVPQKSNSNGGSPAIVTATAVIALSTGANRFLRTAPATTDQRALVTGIAAVALQAVLDAGGRA